MSRAIGLCAALLYALSATRTEAALVIQVDIDGNSGNAAVTFNPKFSFGGNTTGGNTVSSASNAVGLNPGNSILGGNGNPRDIYQYSYTPGVDADNRIFAAGTAFGNGNVSSGLTGGGSGIYAVYATWPFTTNVSGGLTTYEVIGGGNTVLSTQIDQNNKGHNWIKLGNASLVSGTPYTLRQTAGNSLAVSMRSAGVMFELITPTPAAVPEPSSMLLLGLVGVGGLAARRFRRRTIET